MKIPILLYSGEMTNANFSYYSGLGMALYDHSFILIEGNKKILIVSKMNEKLAVETFKFGEVFVYSDLKKDLEKLLKKRKMGIDGRNLNVKIYNFLKKISNPIDISKELSKVRAFKKEIEIEKIKRAVKETKEIIYSVDLKKCKTEKDVEKELLKETLERGLEIAFKPIVSTSKNTSFPHYVPSNVRLKDIVLIDYGIKYQGYCGDISRCFILNNGPWKKDYELVKQVQLEITDEIPNCNFGNELAEFTTKLYKRYKLGEEKHSLGHGIGLEVHEFPSFGRKSKDKLKNSVFTVEPGIYRKNWGVRIEDCIYFDGKKVRVL